jgi:hypothetical protein
MNRYGYFYNLGNEISHFFHENIPVNLVTQTRDISAVMRFNI